MAVEGRPEIHMRSFQFLADGHHVDEAAPDAPAFEQVLKKRLAEVGVYGRGGPRPS